MSELFRLAYGAAFFCGLCLLAGIAQIIVNMIEGRKSTPQIIIDSKARAAERVRLESL